MAPRALLGEDRLAACNCGGIFGNEGLAAIGIGKMQRRESAKERFQSAQGFGQHYKTFPIHLNGLELNPRLRY